MGRQERRSPAQINKTFNSSGTHICFTLLHPSHNFFPIQALYVINHNVLGYVSYYYILEMETKTSKETKLLKV